MAGWRLKLLYDGECPYCRSAAEWLRRRDAKGQLAFDDISSPSFDAAEYGLTRSEVNEALHGILSDGRILRRVDAIAEACRLVGPSWLVAPVRWPGVHWLADRLYRVFSHNRRRLARLVFRPKCPAQP